MASEDYEQLMLIQQPELVKQEAVNRLHRFYGAQEGCFKTKLKLKNL